MTVRALENEMKALQKRVAALEPLPEAQLAERDHSV